MHFVFYFGFQVEVFQKSRNHFLDFLGFSIFGFYDFVFDGFLDAPEDVGVFDFFENQFTLFIVREVHVVGAHCTRNDHVVECLIHISNLFNNNKLK